MQEEAAGPSGSQLPASASQLEVAEKKFEEGIACIKSNDLEIAVELFSEVLQTRAKHYGELALECASAYYRYGSVLLYQAQDSADVFGTNMDPGTAQDEDKENDETVGAHDDDDTNDDDNNKGKAPLLEGHQSQRGGLVDDNDANNGNTTNVDGDLQLAWENLETARAIWAKHADTHHAELAQTHMLLGDVAMENGTFEAAVSDYDACLEQYILSGVTNDDRRIAEVQFKRCCSLQFLDAIPESLLAVQEAIAVLERRKNILMTKSLHDTSNTDEKKKEEEELEKELGDVDAVLEELKEKVEELNNSAEEALATKNALRGAMQQIGNAMMAQGGGLTVTAGVPSTTTTTTTAAAAITATAITTTATGNGNGGMSESVQFDLPKSALTSPVKDLGVVGRGTKRINLTAAVSNDIKKGENKESTPQEKKKPKRSLEDIMAGNGNGNGGDGATTVGF